MADQKISQLAGGGAALATDEIPIARSGANYKITGANIAAAATSVGTLTSLTVSGNVTVNTNTFFVDTVNNRIGIGTVSPTIAPLQAEADADANRGMYVRNINTGTAAFGFVAAASLVGALELRAYSAANSVWPNRAVLNSGSGFTNGLAIVANGATPIEMWTNGSRRLTVDSAGNLGLGVTPSAWTGSGGTVVEIGALGNAIFGSVSLTTYAFNANFDGAWKYSRNGFASRYLQQNGTHQWFTAPSGTAGNAITFTQAMTLDAAGRLLVGYTSQVGDGSAVQIDANTSGSTVYTLRLANTNTASTVYNVARFQQGEAGSPIGVIGTAGSAVANTALRGLFYVGTQSASSFGIATGDITRWTFNSSGHLLAAVDATYDIGASGATRPRDLYLAGNMVGGGWVRAGAASAGAASTTTIGNTTATTVGAAGGASALPATPLGYIIAHVGTTQVKIPYYNA